MTLVTIVVRDEGEPVGKASRDRAGRTAWSCLMCGDGDTPFSGGLAHAASLLLMHLEALHKL